MEHELKHGQALVITGPQGCGKSTMARKIADKHGTFIEIDVREMETPRGLNNMMASEPGTVICDGFPKSSDTLDRLKAMITSDTVMVERMWSAPKMMKVPNFIFCTGDAQPIQVDSADRRFRVVNLGEPK